MPVPDYAARTLNLHNAYRAQHNSPPLEWSNELHIAAMRHATHLASRKGNDKFEPKSNVSWGQNVFELQTRNVTVSHDTAIDRAIKSWYAGITDYNWKTQSSIPGTKTGLNFSQLIWHSTRYVGIGVASNKSGNLLVVVAFYDPAGNYRGEFQANVKQKLKSPATPAVKESTWRSTSSTPSPPVPRYSPSAYLGSMPPSKSRSRSRDPSVPQWMSESVEMHNKFRKKHGSVPLQLDQNLCDEAQAYANSLVTDPSGTLGKGCTVYRVYGVLTPLEAVRKAVPKWYSQASIYNWSAPLLSSQANSFSQLVWRYSKSVGLGVASHDDDQNPLTVVVACYSPPANFTEEKFYRENVRPALY